MIPQPDLEPLPSVWRPRYRLRGHYTVEWLDSAGRTRRVVVPTGYELDGSSEWLVAVLLPMLPAGVLWVLGIRADGPHRAAALVHDWLGKRRTLSRSEIDWAFLQLQLAAGVPPWQAWMRWGAVRLTGWIPWVLRG